MASIFKRDNGTWVIKWKDGAGRYRQRRTTCATKAEARELARELERKAEFQRLGIAPIDRPSSLTFAELLDLYWSSEGMQLRSQHMLPFANKHLRTSLGTLALLDVTSARLDTLLTAKANELEPRSLNHLRGFTHRLFAFAAKRGAWQGENPARAVPRRKVAKRAATYLKPDEVREVLPQVPEQ